jgi:glycosyltransferase involved in cell wall biosynthesis
MQDNEKVSVVIITKNEPRLKYTLESLFKQTFKPYEVIVVIDDEKDLGVIIAEQFVNVLSIKIVLNKYCCGVGGARATGVEVSSGDIIAFIDSDCIADEKWLESIVTAFRRYKDIHAIAGRSIEILYDATSKMCESREVEHFITFAPTQNFAIKRSLIGLVGNFDPVFKRGGEDYDFCVRIASKGLRILYEPKATIYHWRRDFKESMKKAWKDGSSRAHVFLKHGVRILRDASIMIFHGLTLMIFIPLFIASLVTYSPMSVLAMTWILLSITHRTYRAVLMSKNHLKTFPLNMLRSLFAYISSTAFMMTLLKEGIMVMKNI